MSEGYVELHGRSAFSFLRGASQPDELAAACADRGVGAMALCDRGGVYGSARFHAACRELGLKGIVGCELPMVDGTALPVIVKTRAGYQGLCRLLSDMHLGGVKDTRHLAASRNGALKKGEGRLSWADLTGRVEGLVALTGDEEGVLRPYWENGDRDGVRERVGSLRGLFGEGNVFVELQRRHERGEERLVSGLRDLAGAEGLPVVATNGVSYARPQGRALLDVFTCLREKVKLDEAGGLLSRNGQRFVKAPAAMRHLFRDIPEAVENTLRIAEQVEFGLENLGYEFPSYDVPRGESMDTFLRKVVFAGARKRYRGEPNEKTRRQMEHELAVIAKLGFSGYFLIVWDLVNFCRNNEVMAQGRGSAANSVVCFCLEITPVDPVEAGLLFERFLNEERKSWPDIDIDLPSGERRERVIQEVYRRYGRHGAAMTANVITYRRKSAAREVGKVLGFEEEFLGRFSSLFGSHNYEHGLGFEEQLEQSGIAKEHPRALALSKLCVQVLGLPRHLGQHSGGMVVCQGALDTVVPLEPASMPGRSVCQWDKNDCEDLGIVKVDLLGLGMMAVMQDTLENLNRKGVDIDMARIPKNDTATFEMMQRADTVGVFQIESRAQIATLPRMKPKCFYDVVVEVGIIRPGPIQGKMVHPYLERREDPSKIEYIDERLVEVLERTLGVALFQEQILKVAMVMADFTGAEAEELRRAVSTFSTNEKRMNTVLGKLVGAMRDRGVEEEKVKSVVQSVSSFAHYGFPESHAISFGLLAYVSTYLKCHYPEEFFVGLLNNQPMGFYSSATLIQDAKRRGIRVRAVCVVESRWECCVVGAAKSEGGRVKAGGDGTGGSGASSLLLGKKNCGTRPLPTGRVGDQVGAAWRERQPYGVGGEIRLGLVMVKGISREKGKAMVVERDRAAFRSLKDFRFRTRFNKEELRQLAAIGALNCFCGDRRKALWEVESLLGEDDLFAHVEEPEEETLSPLEVMTHLERLQADYAGVGVTVGAHPMASLRGELAGIWRAYDLDTTPNGARVKVAGQVICRQRPGTAKGFVFISMEDETGISNTIVLPQLFEKYRLTITQEKFLVISGVLQRQKGVTHVKADRIEALVAGETPAARSYDFH
ncbi:error-prone DNA polymerase [Pelagicoccus sp. SDUM812002]|uniref:DNA polymerase III subunit alpha n=1 Tax=Pelagicoccus sp. SDUM812002 TaxID=3041266 RepID=UPI00280D347F|nr:error-prone DNA polymerase [Pelagicoccus sp. SDUM812002]MDQ8186010.1 error-prone DNA polymerase [Pelagicoccus sp. SDUM812002]